MDDNKQQEPRPIGEQDLVAGVIVRGSLSARLIIGLIITGAGILLFLGSLGLVDIHFRDVVRCWPALLVAVGLVKVFTRGEGAASRVFGGVLTIFGSLLLLDRFGYLHFDWKLMGPLALVFLGIIIVWRALAGGMSHAGQTDASANLGTVAIMGGVNRKNSSQNFRGGEITALMGGAEIDLTQASPAPEGAVLELFAMWGGIEITVPGDWTVENRVTPLMGGVEDKRRTVGTDPKKHLTLKGLAIMGGVEIKN
jgi:predicted membrane protein